MTGLPDGPLLSWYGDDFTGSAAVLEVLAFGGLDSVLFLDVPTPAQLARFPDARAIGIAGVARSRTPEWMDAHLSRVFQALAALGAPLVHYKICSTLDSAPQMGSIGHAIDIALPVVGGDWVPVLVAAPPIGRYQAFGHLFAAAGHGVHRLDRHPVMSRHPVTPMHESDVALHLGRQTALRARALDLIDLHKDDGGEGALDEMMAAGVRLVTIDTISEADLAAAGRLIWQHRGDRLLIAGSQGVQYALLAHWRAIGALPTVSEPKGAGAVAQIAVVSGSVSATTAAQIAWAAENGFGLVGFDATSVRDPQAMARAVEDAVEAGMAVLSAGLSVLIHSARGPDDPSVAAFRSAVADSGLDASEANARVGAALGQILAQLLERAGLERVVVSGGDTSGHACLQLGVEALTALAPTIPGAALCTAHGKNGSTFQLALKGGQMGTPDYFGWIRAGGGHGNRKSAAGQSFKTGIMT
ncbi:four-carbon acid sugar kinase family protein [Pelagibacterium montanilacus]|uniref:four-carbon acid sugar kinase family protein n=1 Tax=Pelagibacterium montanilacus TaxID=2185280 RepID=UPI000F8F0EB7|nr:four-carbon acid sugar kinase family protein [Pelagibacterium montanilacus]